MRTFAPAGGTSTSCDSASPAARPKAHVVREPTSFAPGRARDERRVEEVIVVAVAAQDGVEPRPEAIEHLALVGRERRAEDAPQPGTSDERIDRDARGRLALDHVRRRPHPANEQRRAAPRGRARAKLFARAPSREDALVEKRFIRERPRRVTSSEVVVEERLAVSHVAVDELPRLRRDLRELRAEARRSVVPAVRRLAAPARRRRSPRTRSRPGARP